MHFFFQKNNKKKKNFKLTFFFQGRLGGLCGNFDGITVNDMSTSSHMEVSNAQAFGDSWTLGQVRMSRELFAECGIRK